MGLNTSLMIGVYLECTMMREQMLDPAPDPKCSAKPKKHRVGHDDKFCPHCGAPVDREPKLIEQAVSFHDILNGDVERPGYSDEQKQEVFDLFEPIHGHWVGHGSDTVELVSFSMDGIDADNEGVHPLDNLEHGYIRPTQEQLDKLIALVGYTDVVVKYGVLVQVA